MQNVPKIVTDRLRATAASTNHPDADVLTAFAERSLSDRERGVVLEHVARCRDCRDVIALALPETETAVLTPSPARRPWLTWPGLRWGFVAAGVLVIASLGLLQYQRKAESATYVAKQSLPNQTAAPVSATQPLPEAAPTDAVSSDKLAQNKDSSPPPDAADRVAVPKVAEPKLAEPKDSERRLRSAPAAPSVNGQPSSDSSQFVARSGGGALGGTIGGQLPRGPKMPAQWQQQLPARASGAATAPAPTVVANSAGSVTANKIPPASEMVEVQAQTATLDYSQNQAGAEPSSADDTTVGKAKLPVTVETENAAVGQTISEAQPAPSNIAQGDALNGRNFSHLVTLFPAARWSISAAGGLQRSLDQGQTWQNVDVNAATLADNQTSLEVVSARALKKTKAPKQAAPAPTLPSLVFRAVTANGAEVWAGGSSGALYHSVDAGTRWTRVMPVSSGTPLTSDIVAVEFSDPQHGRITTATSEVWTTTDDGQTWQKQ
jgi:hypothetical protein